MVSNNYNIVLIYNEQVLSMKRHNNTSKETLVIGFIKKAGTKTLRNYLSQKVIYFMFIIKQGFAFK